MSFRTKQIAPIKTMAIMPGKEQQEARFFERSLCRSAEHNLESTMLGVRAGPPIGG